MWSAPILITPPAAEPLALDAVKEFLSIELDETLHDAQLTRFIAAARAQAEAVTGTRFVPQILQSAASEWRDLMRLPIGPVTAVTEIEWDDTSGAAQTLPQGDYELTGAGLQRGVRSVVGKAWPSGLRRADDVIRVTMAVGYDAVPDPLQTAMLIMIADLFAQRESFVVGTVAARVQSSMQVESLLVNHRIWL